MEAQRVEYILSLISDGANAIKSEHGRLAEDIYFHDALQVAQGSIAHMVMVAIKEGDHKAVTSLTLCPSLTLFTIALNMGVGWERQRRSKAELDNMINLKD